MEAERTDAQVVDAAMTEQGRLRQMQHGFRLIVDALDPDWGDNPHLQGTPVRAAEAWWSEIFAGITQGPPEVTTFENEGDSGMIVLNNIPVKSVCAHHLLPFVGTASVGYTMEDRLVGLSKLSRIVDYWARRPQVQEQLTNQVADHLAELGATGVGVVIRANHMCMSLRGVQHDGDMRTSALRGVFAEPEVRAEFLNLAGG